MTAKSEILALAKQHRISHQHTKLDRLGEDICRLSDNETELDEIQWLLIELARAGIFKKNEDLILSAKYTEERRNAIRPI